MVRMTSSLVPVAVMEMDHPPREQQQAEDVDEGHNEEKKENSSSIFEKVVGDEEHEVPFLLLNTKSRNHYPHPNHQEQPFCFSSTSALSPTLSLPLSHSDVDEDEDYGTSISLQPCLRTACHGVHELLQQMVSKDDPSRDYCFLQGEPLSEDDHANGCDDGFDHRHLNNLSMSMNPASPHSTTTTTDLMVAPTASSFDTDTSSLAGFLADYHSCTFHNDNNNDTNTTNVIARHNNNRNHNKTPPLAAKKKTTSTTASTSSPRNNLSSSQNAMTTAAYHRMGHSPLVQLCSWTLEQVQGCETPPACLLLSPENTSKVLSSTNNMTTSTTPLAAATQRNDNKSKTKMGKPKTPFRSTNQTQQQQQLVRVTTPRYTMFASEYARHLASFSSSFAKMGGGTIVPPLSSVMAMTAGAATTTMQPHASLSFKANRRNTTTKTSAMSSLTIPLLHQAEASVQSGAVLDLVVTTGETTPPPPGYYRILPGIVPKNNTQNQIKKQVCYLNVKKEINWDKAAQRPVITSLVVLHTATTSSSALQQQQHDFVPPGFCVVKQYPSKQPAKLGNAHLVFKRSREGNPLTDIILLQPPASIPPGYTVVERTPRNHPAHLGGTTSGGTTSTSSSTTGSGNYFFVAYRQRLANLEALRPLPLIQAAQPKAGADFVDYDNDNYESSSSSGCGMTDQLHAYYATGATTVASAVGRFHILDRSTHSLLSPSSVQNRLALVQLSRTSGRGGVTGNNTIAGGGGLGASGSSNDSLLSSQLAQALEYDVYNDNNNDDDDDVEEEEHAQEDSMDIGMMPHVTMLSHFFKLSLEPKASVQQCWNALNFIPAVETCGNVWLLQERMVVLTPLLTACYTRHGGSAQVAVQSLTQLLQSDFFAHDLMDAGQGRVPNLTLLDLSVQAVCDVGTTSCFEASLANCVEFVQLAMAASQGYLSSRSLGYVFRFYLFVFYFGASTWPNSPWPNPKWLQQSTKLQLDQDIEADAFRSISTDMCILTDPRSDDKNLSYLPGGAPQAAALALKEYLHLLLLRLGKSCVLSRPQQPGADRPPPGDILEEEEEIGAFLGTILSGMVETAVENVERANYTQLAYYQIHRSGGSELFWHDMITTCAPGLFRNNDSEGIYGVVFAVLANLVKVALGKVRTDRSLLHSRDVASKLLALELLLYFLEMFADGQEALGENNKQNQQELVFSIRRMVVPCLLSSTRSALEDPQVHSRVLRIVSELWLSPLYRQHCKVELGILMEHFGLRMLHLKPQLRMSTRLDLWSEASNTSLLAQQVEVIKEIKKWCAEPKDVIEMFLNYDTDICMTGPVQLVPGTRWKLFQRMCTSLTHIAEQCGEQIGKQIQESRNLQHRAMENGDAVRLLRTISLETISQIVKSLAAATSSSDKFTALLMSWGRFDPPLLSSKSTKRGGERGSEDVRRFWSDAIAAGHHERLSSEAPTQEESRQVALEISRRKSLKKAIEYLIACNALTPSPRDIANFLRLHKDELDPASLGEYLSESGLGVETEWWNSIRHLYVRAISFVGMQVEEGLRHFLTNCGFRLPGEAQRIDRIMSTFAKCYFEDNAGDSQRCPFKYEDTVYLLAFAIIMLNTDLHRPIKPRKKMTKVEFIHNLRGAEQGEDIPKEYLVKVFESIESNPIVLNPDLSTAVDSSAIQDMLNNVRSADTLLRGLAVHDFHCATIDDFCEGVDYNMQDALSDLTRCCVSKTWHQWHGVINTGLETAHLDPLGMEPSLEILVYALALTVSLDMPTERAAFLSQLCRVKAFEERRQGRYVTAGEPESSVGEWFRKLEHACSGSEDEKLWALQEIRDWTVSFKSALLVDAQNRVTMQAVLRQLKDSDLLLQDPARSFLRAGNLIKKSSRTGRSIAYRFYLFSDVLLYAKEEADGRFKVHEELPVHLLKIIDWFPPSQKNRKIMFEVNHPRKSFFVLCPSAKERKSWVRDIKAAVHQEMDRKMKIEASRMAATR